MYCSADAITLTLDLPYFVVLVLLTERVSRTSLSMTNTIAVILHFQWIYITVHSALKSFSMHNAKLLIFT